MDMFVQMVNIQAALLLYLLCGILCRRLKIITPSNQQNFIDLLLTVLMPCMVFNSFRSITLDMLRNTLSVMTVSLAVCLLSWVLGKLLYRRAGDRQPVLRYATLINNAGFAGMPLAQEMFGQEGLIYASVFLIPQRIFMWSYGLSMFTTVSGREVVKKIITHPCIIAVALGLVVMCLYTNGIYIPSALDDTIGQIGGCVTALSMMLIGAILSDVALKEMLNRTALVYSFYRLLLIPALVGLILWMLPLDILSIKVSILLTAMPAASTSAMLAEKYGRDYKFASELIMTSTILSLFTIPLVATALEWIF